MYPSTPVPGSPIFARYDQWLWTFGPARLGYLPSEALCIFVRTGYGIVQRFDAAQWPETLGTWDGEFHSESTITLCGDDLLYLPHNLTCGRVLPSGQRSSY